MRKLLQSISRLLILPLFITPLFLITNHLTAQPSPETWMDMTKSPTISAGKIISGYEYRQLLESSQSVFSDLECVERSVDFAPRDHPSNGMPYDGCWFSTNIGLLEKGGHGFRPSGWEVGGYVNSFNSQLYPTKHPEHFIEYTSDQSIIIRRSDRFIDQARVTPADTGWDFPVFHEWVYPNASFKLEHSDHTPWKVDPSVLNTQMWYSSNGKYLATWHTDGYFVLLDFETLTIKTIDSGTGSGYASLAVSDNGRYVAINNYNDRGITVVDTQSCPLMSPDFVLKDPVSCSSRLFADEFIEAGSQEAYGVFPVFYSDDLLGYYIPHGSDGYREYVLRAPNTRRGTNYLALGDSYSSGEGAYNYKAGTDNDGNRCHLSDVSYPYLLGASLNFDKTRSVACSGALTRHITSTVQHYSPPGGDQWLPGKNIQLDYLSLTHADIVTIGIGGNDALFSKKIPACLMPGDCYDTYSQRISIARDIVSLFYPLVQTFEETRARALEHNPESRVYAIGYPEIFIENGHCPSGINLSDKDIEFANLFIRDLNAVVRRASERAGVNYIDVEKAFVGYRLCEGSPLSAAHMLVKGNDVFVPSFGPFGNESFHPTLLGQVLLAREVKIHAGLFRRTNPWPDKSILSLDKNETLLFKSVEPDEYDNTYHYYYEGLLGTRITTEDLSSSFHAPSGSYAPDTTTKAIIASKPTQLGTYTADRDGGVSGELKIPENFPIGFHTLHLTGRDSDGRIVDLYEVVFVGKSLTDIDGDGVINEIDDCIDIGNASICNSEDLVIKDQESVSHDSTPLSKGISGKSFIQSSRSSLGEKSDTNTKPFEKDSLVDNGANKGFSVTKPKTAVAKPFSSRSISPVWKISTVFLMLLIGYGVSKYIRSNTKP